MAQDPFYGRYMVRGDHPRNGPHPHRRPEHPVRTPILACPILGWVKSSPLWVVRVSEISPFQKMQLLLTEIPGFSRKSPNGQYTTKGHPGPGTAGKISTDPWIRVWISIHPAGAIILSICPCRLAGSDFGGPRGVFILSRWSSWVRFLGRVCW